MSNLKVYKASAGSGKTFTLALEYIRELLTKRSDHAHRSVLAVTFTKDATGEMKDRILSELYGLAFNCTTSGVFREALIRSLAETGVFMNENEIREKSKAVLHAILHDYSHLHITTIDSFFQKVLRNLARELGRGSRFNLEMNTVKVLSEAVRSVIEQANEDPQLLEWLMMYIEEKLDDGGYWRIDREILDFSRCIFNEYFQEHEYALKQQLQENSSAFRQIKESHAKIQNDCKIFFKETYATVSSLMLENGLEAADFNRNGVAINFLSKLSNGDFATANAGSAVVRDCCSDAAKWPSGKTKKREVVIALAGSHFLPLLNQTLDILRKYQTSRMITRNIHQLGLIWDITNEIGRQNAENNRFMLSDTSLFLNRMIDDSDTSFIYEKIGAEIKHVMIDEFQDTSRLQWKNFKSLLSEILANNYFSMIVGDVKQSIYRWRNGDWSILDHIGQELNVESRSLGVNYRSEKRIVDFNNRFFGDAAVLLNEKYSFLFGEAKNSPFLRAYSPAEVEQQAMKNGEYGFVSVSFIPDKSDDFKYDDLVLKKLLEQLSDLHRKGIPAHRVCILARTNKHIIRTAEYMAAYRAEYPELARSGFLNIVSDEAFQLGSSPALRILIEGLRVLSDASNPVFRAKLEYYLKQYDLCSVEMIPEHLILLPLMELAGHLYRMFGLGAIDGQSGYLYAFYDAMGIYLKDNPSDVHAFLAYWEEELQFKSVSSGMSIEGVRAMTIHKSKGLQFHTVILPFCDWELSPEKNPVVWCGPKDGLYDLELLPVRYSHQMFDTVFRDEYRDETVQSWMDNLNLLYVALTRAEHNLLVLSKDRGNPESSDDIKRVSDVLRFILKNFNENFNEDLLYFETGNLDIRVEEHSEKTDNLLKQTPQMLTASFISESFDPVKSIFKQSNKSREFITPDALSKDDYVLHGNIMHALFAPIETMDDIEAAVDKLIFEGIILPGQRDEYAGYVRHSICNSKVESWFSGRYKTYNECTVLTGENGEVRQQRPDKVLISETETIIIDFKFGAPLPEHRRQMQRYMQLMKQMYPRDPEAFIWYVELNKILMIKGGEALVFSS